MTAPEQVFDFAKKNNSLLLNLYKRCMCYGIATLGMIHEQHAEKTDMQICPILWNKSDIINITFFAFKSNHPLRRCNLDLFITF